MKYQPYPAYKDSGVEWLGQVPEHWEVKRIKWSVSDIRNGIWGNDPQNDENDITCIRVADFDRERLRVSLDNPTMRNVLSKERLPRLLFKGDLLIEKSGGGENQPVGVVVLYDSDKAAVCSNFVARMTLRDGMNPSYWRYMHAASYSARLNIPSIKQTSGIQNLDQNSYLDELVPYPPAREQVEIAAGINRVVNCIDALISKKTRFIELLQEKRQALITRAVTRGLNPDAPMKDSGVEWIGEVPEHWDIPKLRHIAAIQTGIALGKNPKGHDVISVPYLRVANVQDGFLDLDEVATVNIRQNELNRYRVQVNDVLMNEGGDNNKLGRGHIWAGEIDNCIHQNHVFVVRPHGVLSKWLNAYKGSLTAQAFFTGRAKQSTNLASISSNNLRDLPVPRPPKSEQIGILNYLEQLTPQIDTLITKTRRSIELLQERRSALITAAVTGQIDLREAA